MPIVGSLFYRHVVISPIRDEGHFLPALIESIEGQSIPPMEWIIVDDFSEDKSVEIIEEAMKSRPWITLIRNQEDGIRERGARIATLFNKGIEASQEGWDFISKIDGDMLLPQGYFEEIFAEFTIDEGLGIASGNCLIPRTKKVEKVEENHTRGGLKTYRRECFEHIGGVSEIDGWDGIDNSMAQKNGWKTRNFPRILVEHRRATGSYDGFLNRNFNSGKKSHIMGYRWDYLVAKSLHGMKKWPFFFGGFMIFIGFFWSKISGVPQLSDRDLILFIRETQKERIRRFFTRK
jgi:glycosyltransferase involved in cell wall biosynthesis